MIIISVSKTTGYCNIYVVPSFVDIQRNHNSIIYGGKSDEHLDAASFSGF